ncbi:MAG: DUF4416 family protein [Candidatus Aadella gelida]|nr:DUF4416 family protein [Candidatus Aadella gelida]
MGKIFEQKKVKLIVSMIYRSEDIRAKAERRLSRIYGNMETLKKELPFDYTDYYAEEMGSPLKRELICFKKLVNKENISKIKIRTNKLENFFRKKEKRTINIDPGYVTEAKLVLLTTKDYTHRVYIGKRIFAESTLNFCDGEFKAWPWTYPDYASQEMREYFEEVREMYMKQTRSKNKG